MNWNFEHYLVAIVIVCFVGGIKRSSRIVIGTINDIFVTVVDHWKAGIVFSHGFCESLLTQFVGWFSFNLKFTIYCIDWAVHIRDCDDVKVHHAIETHEMRWTFVIGRQHPDKVVLDNPDAAKTWKCCRYCHRHDENHQEW